MTATAFTRQAGVEVPLICGAMYPCSNPELVAAVWVGEPQSNLIAMRPPVTRITVLGGTFPARIWQIFASSALASTPASTARATPGRMGMRASTGRSRTSATSAAPSERFCSSTSRTPVARPSNGLWTPRRSAR